MAEVYLHKHISVHFSFSANNLYLAKVMSEIKKERKA